MTPVVFSEWRPDAPALGPYCQVASGVVPKENDNYGPVASLFDQTNALADTVIGGISAKDASGNVYIYAATSAKIYEGVSSTFTDQSKSGGYSTAADDVVEMVSFRDQIITTNYADAVQSMDVGTGSSNDFADHFTSTEKPKAKHIGVVGNFLVLGFVNDSAGATMDRVRWSNRDDSTDMDASQTTLSGFRDMGDGGGIQRIIGGPEYGLIFQEERIRRMSFVGTPNIFSFSGIIDPSRGTNVPNSVVSNGRDNYFWSEEGIFMTNGQAAAPVGEGKVDKWLLDQFDPAYKHRVSSAVDVKHKLIVWAFPGSGSVDGAPNTLLFYHWPSQRFSYALIDCDMLIKSYTQGMNVDSGIITDIDASPWASISIDSDTFKGGRFQFAAFNTNHKLAYFSGDALAAQIDTNEIRFGIGRSLVLEAWPIIDGGTTTAKVGTRVLPTDSVTWTSAVSINEEGFCPFEEDSVYHRLRADIAAAGSWTHAQGFQVEVVPLGNY